MSNRKFSVSDWNSRHFARVEDYVAHIQKVYQVALEEATRIAVELAINPNKEFRFSDYPQTAERVRTLLGKMAMQMLVTIQTGQKAQWEFANQKNDALVGSVLRSSALSRATVSRYMSRNLEALSAFQQRKTGGLGLSDRVFNYVSQFRREIEMGLDVGLGEGRSAAQISQGLRSHLNDPDKLFRRVRTQRGSLALSKSAQVYHPGQGTYRSSYKNAMRLTRTEINMAYREADHLRYAQLDFVVGIEVRRSTNIVSCEVCPQLVGLYPKDFKFTGWHPQCRCYAIPILSSPDELRQLNRSLLINQPTNGLTSVNQVVDVNAGFKQFIEDNQDTLKRVKKVPYFIRDNPKYSR